MQNLSYGDYNDVIGGNISITNATETFVGVNHSTKGKDSAQCVKMKEYVFYNRCYIRTPFYPINKVKNLTGVESFVNEHAFKNAIYIASQSLFDDVYNKNLITNKITDALVRYYTRACSRSTPYGMFAGCTVANVTSADKSEVVLDEENKNTTYSRIDMKVLCDIVRMIEHDPEIRKQLKYHTNTSIYGLSKSSRYIEHTLLNNECCYTLPKTIKPDYLDSVFKFVDTCPRSIDEIVSFLMSSDVTHDDAFDYVNKLVDQQIIVSNLEPSVAGSDYITQIVPNLPKGKYRDDLIYIKNALSDIDKSPINSRCEKYDALAMFLSEKYNANTTNMFHVDCKIQEKSAVIGNDVKNAFYKGLQVMKHFSHKDTQALDTFKREFYKRYEEEEIPLAIALDPQIGIPFGVWNSTTRDREKLLNGLSFNTPQEESSYKNDELEHVLQEKYVEYIKTGAKYINLTKKDLEKLPKDGKEYHEYTSNIQVINTGTDNAEAEIFMNNCYTDVASIMLSRFSYLDENISNLVSEINSQEEKYNPDCLLAEILYFPNNRTGNILMHPIQRKYAIPYCSNPIMADCNVTTIPIEDIMVSVPNGENVKLRSLKHNKEIMPLLTNAHNYVRGLPLYMFLCVLHLQYENIFSFEWPGNFKLKKHLPQVRYENIILSREKWKIEKSDVLGSYDKIMGWKETNGIPDLVVITEGDNKLLIDFNNKMTVNVFADYLNSRKQLTIEEFLYSGTTRPMVTRGDNWFTNEIILTTHK